MSGRELELAAHLLLHQRGLIVSIPELLVGVYLQVHVRLCADSVCHNSQPSPPAVALAVPLPLAVLGRPVRSQPPCNRARFLLAVLCSCRQLPCAQARARGLHDAAGQD
jgi:hypothetical protein